ncbi:MAG: PAS domain S-box protein [Chloroflexales bacterium]|nr:PAS domain S-box protein [Chloroflexales bacterium]
MESPVSPPAEPSDGRSVDAALPRLIVDQAPEGILVATPAGRFRMVNPTAAELLGYDPPALRGRTWQDLIVGEARPADLPPGPIQRQECRVRHQDGHELTIAPWLRPPRTRSFSSTRTRPSSMSTHARDIMLFIRGAARLAGAQGATGEEAREVSKRRPRDCAGPRFAGQLGTTRPARRCRGQRPTLHSRGRRQRSARGGCA